MEMNEIIVKDNYKAEKKPKISKVKAILAIIVIFLVGYIVIDYNEEYQGKRYAEYYDKGSNDGVNYIIREIGNTGKIPLYINQTVQWFPVEQFCQE